MDVAIRGIVKAEGVEADVDVRSAHQLVLVEWHDAWFDFDLPSADERRVDYLVRTVGFLVAEDPRFLSLAQEVLPEDEGFRAVTHIPVAIIERIMPLGPRASGTLPRSDQPVGGTRKEG